ncbi:hypothetical protein B9T23_13150 [Acinetobacter terrae]|uniref:AbiTii domain-containing protein n=1 Tax=Acinetobacter terrae TaxID=2731247 RepID=UPI000A3409B7|nr:hypothetical protein [Acinetobacter terrae]OTG73951.1 hypothetical protein B9T23_13150 [Acinetobacter terrae]
MKATIALKKMSLDPKAKITDILRHAYAIADNLDLQDFKTWCKSELRGYDDSKDTFLPEYRHIEGTLHAFNIIKGSHYMINSDGVTHPMKQAIIFFQEYLSKNQDTFDLIFPTDTQNSLKQVIRNSSDQLSIYQKVDRAAFERVVDNVRTMVLELAIDLEKQGILGEEWEFTEQEKLMTQNFNYNIGNVGNMANHNENSAINQISTNIVNVIKGDFNYLASSLRSHGVEESDIKALQTIIDVTPIPQTPSEYSSDLKNWIKNMIGKSIEGTWQVTVGAAGSILATGIQNYFGFIS